MKLIDQIEAALKGIHEAKPQLGEQSQAIAAKTMQGLRFLKGYLTDQQLCQLDQPSSEALREARPTLKSFAALEGDHACAKKASPQFQPHAPVNS